MGKCEAVRWSDEQVCTTCVLRWDINDPEPPPCPKMVEKQKKDAEQAKGLVDRVCEALDMTPRRLASVLKVSYKFEVEPLLGRNRADLTELDRSVFMSRMAQLVDERLGKLMAAREDMQSKIQFDRQARAARRAAIRDR